MLHEAEHTLHTSFGHDAFRPQQAVAIDAALHGRDSLVILPTGGGKSLCYQIPALTHRRLGRGPTLVISPLIALMQDQVDGLRRLGIQAQAVHSHNTHAQNQEILAQFQHGALDLLYVAPERAVLDGFLAQASRAQVALLAVDEAHCISQWGHDFRPEYRQVAAVREALDDVPVMALTATATPTVAEDISNSLGLDDPVVVIGDFVRPNLTFAAHAMPTDQERVDRLAQHLDEHWNGHGRCIVYVATRKAVQKVHQELKTRGYPVAYYHAGRTALARERARQAYERYKCPVLIATNAFGMGIDHPDVRLIVHFNVPGSLEAYYQEAGRGGRDGATAHCYLYYGERDFIVQKFLQRGKKGADSRLAAMRTYVQTESCRQTELAKHFGAAVGSSCGRCDQCTFDEGAQPRPSAPSFTVRAQPKELDATSLHIIEEAAAHLKRPVGKTTLALALRGSRAKNVRKLGLVDNPRHGALADHAQNDIVSAIEQLLSARILEHRGSKYPTVWPHGKPVRPRQSESSRPRLRYSPLRRALENYRQRQARRLKWKPYMVFHRKVIDAIERDPPDNLSALERVHGLGPAKISRFGSDLLSLIETHR